MLTIFPQDLKNMLKIATSYFKSTIKFVKTVYTKTMRQLAAPLLYFPGIFVLQKRSYFCD